MNELRQANEHFDKRFSHLKEVEFAANAKYVNIFQSMEHVINKLDRYIEGLA